MAGTGKSHLREGDVVLRVEGLVVEFPISRHATVSAVAGISFDVLKGETLGIVGESGCDEPVSALDVSVQAQVLNLLEDLKREYNLTLMFIAHDLAVVKNISDRIAVLYLGKMCEIAPSDDLYKRPAHPYTQGLVNSIPKADPSGDRAASSATMIGEPPSPVNPPSGCRFHPRCAYADEVCATTEPTMCEKCLVCRPTFLQSESRTASLTVIPVI